MRVRRSSPGILALVALAFSLGAGTFAGASHLRVERSDFVDNAVTGRKVAPNSITGKDVKESTLGQVKNADKVDGASIVRFRHRSQAEPGNPRSNVFRLGGLRVASECPLMQPDVAFPRIIVTTSVDHATFQYALTEGAPGFGDSHHAAEVDFRPGENVTVTEAQAMISFSYSRAGGHVVEGVLSMSQQGPNCMIDGVARGA